MKHFSTKISILVTYLMTILLLTQSCSTEEEPVPKPIASFSAGPTSITEGESVTFTNTSTNEETLLWTFVGGSPATSTIDNPTVTYSTPGNFDVVLTVINASGSDIERKEALVSVEALDREGPTVTNIVPVSNETDIAITTNITITFSEPVDINSVSNTSVILSGGASNSIATVVSITGSTMTINPDSDLDYDTEYLLRLSDLEDSKRNPMSSEFSSKFTTELEPPEANFSLTIDNYEVKFTNSSSNANSYSWDFGDGSTSTEVSPTKIYDTSGTYTVTLTANGNGSNQLAKEVVIQQLLPDANFNFTVNGFEVKFTNSSSNASSYSWNFGNGSTSTAISPTTTYAANGVYQVTLTANGDGTDQITKEVVIAVEVNLPIYFVDRWYNVAGTWIYGFDTNSQGKYVLTGNQFYYYNPLNDVSIQVISGKNVYKIVGTSSTGTRTFWIKARGNAGNNIIDVSQTSATTGFTEYGNIVGTNVRYAKFQNGNYIEFIGSGIWEERRPNGSLVASFTQNSRDDWSVYLTKIGTGESFSIDVFTFKFKLAGNNLYDIVEATL